ncbi:hypothetical protein TNCV_3827701 [Trichonephila clavipes]|nr:hypothetical protein TNCV_3827701 [Trichonephila clavipes]
MESLLPSRVWTFISPTYRTNAPDSDDKIRGCGCEGVFINVGPRNLEPWSNDQDDTPDLAPRSRTSTPCQ